MTLISHLSNYSATIAPDRTFKQTTRPSGKELQMARELISEQLRDLNVLDMDRMKPLVDYYQDQARFGSWGDYWNNRIVQVLEADDFIVVLFEQHTWSDSGGGIEMATFVEVVFSEKLYRGDKIVYRHKRHEYKDRWDLAYSKILAAVYDGDKFTIRLRCGESGPEGDVVVCGLN